jgi:hypothetical protein
VVGAAALLVVGGVHLEQYIVAHYSVIPTIGPLFLVNFIAATALGLLLLIPMRGSSRRLLLFDSFAALSGIGIAAGALAGLLISEQTPLFGFTEFGYRLEIVIALVSEVVAILSLGVFLTVANRRTAERRQKDGGRDDTVKGISPPAAREA